VRDIPSTYIVASQDRTIRPDWQRPLARERLIRGADRDPDRALPERVPARAAGGDAPRAFPRGDLIGPQIGSVGDGDLG
jgi:hypothetical protein